MYKYLSKVNTPDDIKSFSLEELLFLCEELHDFITKNVLITGGHLGSSLGTIELTVALHKIFNAPHDKIIWDIGHQAYSHKILTGRRDKFHTIRQWEGLSGFSNPKESIYDEFVGGHSSTAVSSAIGMKIGLQSQGINSEVIGIIGDAAIGAGMAFEALNHIGALNTKVIIILNDNSMSISATEGALSKYFTRIKASKNFTVIKNIGKEVIKKLPSAVGFLAKKIDLLTRNTHEANIFEELGFKYIGPVDGHNLENLISVITAIKDNNCNNPILLHVVTKKGNGHKDVNNSSDALHGVEGVNNNVKINNEIKASNNTIAAIEQDLKEKLNEVSNSKVFSTSLVNVAKEDKNIVVVSAAMLKGTGLDSFQKAFQERTFDVGIAEQHAVTFAAAMAKSGIKPFVCIYSTFMQRAYDQVVHDVCLDSLPVRFVMDRAGFVGADGATHHGVLDYSMFLPLPNIVFMAVSFVEDIDKMVQFMSQCNNAPSFLRFSKNRLPLSENYEKLGYTCKSDIVLGKGKIVKQGEDVAVLSIGEIIHEVILASEKLRLEDNKIITIADMKFLKPIDEDLIINLAKTHNTLIVLEEGLSSIFASIVMKVLIKNNLFKSINFKAISMPDFYVEHGEIEKQKHVAGLNYIAIYQAIKRELGENFKELTT